jgi:hypothetical protein
MSDGKAREPLDPDWPGSGSLVIKYVRRCPHGGFAGAEFMTTPRPLLAEISAELVPS